MTQQKKKKKEEIHTNFILKFQLDRGGIAEEGMRKITPRAPCSANFRASPLERRGSSSGCTVSRAMDMHGVIRFHWDR